MRIGIFGGTFDPIHNGHMCAAYAFFRQAALERLYVIPDKIPPHKEIGAGDDPTLRFEMTAAAFAAAPAFEGRAVVSDMELKSEGKSYTYRTLKRFTEMGFSDIWLYCGTDMLLTIDEWHRAEELLSMCHLAYAARERQSEELSMRVEKKKAFLYRRYGAEVFDISVAPLEISSTEIRRRIAAGDDVSELIPPAVHEFIRERHLYR